VGQIVAVESSAGNDQGEPSAGNQSTDREKCVRSEEASSASGNRCLANNDMHRWITQNRRQQEYGRDPTDLHNIINERRRLRARTMSPPRCSPVRAPTPLGRGAFRALAPELRQFVWPDKFKPRPIDK
jgi:hypothetical protein